MNKLTEEAIRPQKLMSGQKIAALVDLGRMLSRTGDFVEVACPACGSYAAAPRFGKNGIRYVTCTACQTFYVNPRPPSEVLDWFYGGSPNYAYWNEHIFPASEAARRQHIFIPRVERLLELCRRHQVRTDALLEVGAGFGTFGSELISRNVFKRVVGVEPTPGLAQTCRARGIEVIEQPIEHVSQAAVGEFDVVASFEVIEHLFSPVEFVRHMVGLMRPGGVLMLTCPNGQGFDVETLGAVSTTVDHEHLNYFNPASLSGLLERCGLQMLESFTPGRLDAELVRNKVLEGEFSLTDQPFLQKVLIDEWDRLGSGFQQYIVDQNLSSNLWVVARKPAG